jgi:hypothetical protein
VVNGQVEAVFGHVLPQGQSIAGDEGHVFLSASSGLDAPHLGGVGCGVTTFQRRQRLTTRPKE